MDGDFGFAQCAPADRTTVAYLPFANRLTFFSNTDELPSQTIARKIRQRHRYSGRSFNAANC